MRGTAQRGIGRAVGDYLAVGDQQSACGLAAIVDLGLSLQLAGPRVERQQKAVRRRANPAIVATRPSYQLF
jgi:hypothetical protein